MIIDNPKIEDMRKQVEARQYCHVRYRPSRRTHLLDMYSMSVLVQLHDAMEKQEAKDRLNQMVSSSYEQLTKALNFGLRHAK